MTENEKKEFAVLLAAATVEALNQSRSIDELTHLEEHTYIRERIEKEKQRADFYRKVTQAVTGTLLAAAAIWLGSKAIDFIVWASRQTQ